MKITLFPSPSPSLPLPLPLPPLSSLPLPPSFSLLPPPSSPPPLPLQFPNGTNATGSEVLGYEILYWPRSTTTYMVHQVPTETEGVILKPLSSFTKYAVVVRLYCSPGNRSGRASPITEFTTSPACKSIIP